MIFVLKKLLYVEIMVDVPQQHDKTNTTYITMVKKKLARHAYISFFLFCTRQSDPYLMH
jgi:hypothetical protein